jgi:acetyl esterase/lipase
MKFSKLFIAIIIGTTLFSCKKNSDSNNNPAAGQTILNIAYGTDPLQKMDVYLPPNANAATTKVIIALHGGGWREGDKVDLQNFAGINFIDTLKKRLPDYAIFNVNYRLSTGVINLFPIQENDIKAALEFIFSKSTDYAISNKYVLIGASAGAHLAMLQGYKYSAPVKPKAIVSFFGPGDLTDMYNNPAGGVTAISTILALTIGKTPTQDAALYTNSSPATFINSSSPPTILFHGGADPLVKPSQSELIKNKLTASGIANQYTLYPGKGHGDDWGSALYADAFSKIQVFLAANVQ